MLVRYGEIFLKSGHTQRVFRDKLNSNILWRLSKEGFDCRTTNLRHRILLTPQCEGAAEVASNVFGVKSASPVIMTDSGMNAILEKSIGHARQKLSAGKSFAVRARRTSGFAKTSKEIEEDVGALLKRELGNPVNLTKPDFTLHIEVLEDKTFIFSEIFPGVGGLPYGCEALLLAIVENQDDVLACWHMMRRGAQVHALASRNMLAECEKLLNFSDGSLKISLKDEETVESILSKKQFFGVISGGKKPGETCLNEANLPIYCPLVGGKFLPKPQII